MGTLLMTLITNSHCEDFYASNGNRILFLFMYGFKQECGTELTSAGGLSVTPDTAQLAGEAFRTLQLILVLTIEFQHVARSAAGVAVEETVLRGLQFRAVAHL